MSKFVPSPPDPERRLRLLGLLARRIGESTSLYDLMRFLYALLREHLPVDGFFVTVAASPARAPRPLLIIIEEQEQAPEAVATAEEPIERDAAYTTAVLAPWRTAERMPQSQIVCAVRAAGHTLGHLTIVAHAPDAYSGDDQQFLETIAAQLAGSFERHIAAARHEERHTPAGGPPSINALTTIAAALGAISSAIAEENNPEHLFAAILEHATRVLPHEHAAISLFEEGTVRIAAVAGHVLAPFLTAPEHQRALRAPHMLHLATGSGDAELRRTLSRAGLADALSIPLTVNGAMVGRLTFATAQHPPFAAHHVQFGMLLAERTAQAVRMGQLQAAHEAARTKVAQLDSLRHDFVATVSHELRTPLTGILGYMELLLNRWTSLDDERRRSMLQRAQSSAVRLEHLVTDLLLFSNVEHQELKLQIADYPLAMLVEQAVDDMRTKYRGQAIVVRPSARRAVVRADAQRVIQVLTNLLDNAIKYSAEGTPVAVRWMPRDREVEVAVRDHGPGIKPEDMPRLFSRFGTLGHQPRPGQVGTGIGLYICKKLLDAMGGRIWVASTPGRGSIFHFTLPSALEQDGVAGR